MGTALKSIQDKLAIEANDFQALQKGEKVCALADTQTALTQHHRAGGWISGGGGGGACFFFFFFSISLYS